MMKGNEELQQSYKETLWWTTQKSEHFSVLLLLPPKCACAKLIHCSVFCPKVPFVVSKIHRKGELS